LTALLTIPAALLVLLVPVGTRAALLPFAILIAAALLAIAAALLVLLIPGSHAALLAILIATLVLAVVLIGHFTLLNTYVTCVTHGP